jgi:hypothetical protein
MERLASAWRITSSAAAAAALVLSNLVPLAGVLWWGWDLFIILTLYWVENGIVGVYNVAKIMRAQGSGGAGGMRMTLNGRPVEGMARGALAGFFALHYGAFWIGHGIFVLIFLPLMASGFGTSVLLNPDGSVSVGLQGLFGPGPDWGLVAYGAVALAISHGVSYRANYIGRGEYLTASPAGQMMAPYGRLVILHVTIVLGASVSVFVGSPVGSLLVLVALKIVLDLFFHLREHRRAAAPTPIEVSEPNP